MNVSSTNTKPVPLLVASCDRYADIWRPFFTVFRKQWPDCPYPLYLGTNFKVFPDDRVATLTVGEDVSWAESLLKMLDLLDCEYVLLWLEDFFLLDPVDSGSVEKLVNLALTEKTGCLRLYSILPPPRCLEQYPELGYFAPGDDYRVTLQAAIWRVRTLRSLLVPGFNPWEFEILGNKLSESLVDRFWGVMQPVVRYEQVVEKGRWKPVGIEICKDAGVEVDLQARPVFGEQELLAHYHSGEPGSPAGRLYALKRAMLESFQAGRKTEGLRQAALYLKKRPCSGHIILGVLFGLLGSGALARLLRFHLRCQILTINCRHRYNRLRLRLRRPPWMSQPDVNRTGED